MHDLVSQGHQVILTSVATEGLGKEWLGRVLAQQDVEELESLAEVHRFNIDGEGGEFETAVIDAPWMKYSIITQHTVHWTGRRGWIDIWGAELN